MQENEKQHFGSSINSINKPSMISQNSIQNYDSLLYSEITENNDTLLNTPQHPFKQKNPLLKNTQQGDSGQVSERQQTLYSANNRNSSINNIGGGGSNGKGLQQNAQNTVKSGTELTNNNKESSAVRQQVKKSPEKIKEFRINTEEDEDIENNNQGDIERMDMSGNLISKIQKLEAFPKLIYLNLSYNRIQIIENLESLPLLQFLNLSFNLIKQIPFNIKFNSQLQHLLLSSNKISSVESLQHLIQLTHLKELDLLDNPIQEDQNYKNYIKSNLKQVMLLDQKNIHISNLNSIGESWNSQLSFSNPNSIIQSAHFQKKGNQSQLLQQQQNIYNNVQFQQNDVNIQSPQLMNTNQQSPPIESNHQNQLNQWQNRQTHIYSFGSQQNENPSNQMFGIDLNIQNNQISAQQKKPLSFDMKYQGIAQTNNNIQNQQISNSNEKFKVRQKSNDQFYNNTGEMLKQTVVDEENDLDSEGNILDRQFQEQRTFFSHTKSDTKSMQGIHDQQRLMQQQQFLQSPQGIEGSNMMFENFNNHNNNHMKSIWQNSLDNINQTFNDSINKNQISTNKQNNIDKLENSIQEYITLGSDNKRKESKSNDKESNMQNNIQDFQDMDFNYDEQILEQRRHQNIEQQFNEQLLPKLSEREAQRLKKCLFQQNNELIEVYQKQFEQSNKKNKDQQNDYDEQGIDMNNLQNISNYIFDESSSKNVHLSNQNNNQQHNHQYQNIPNQPPKLPARDESQQYPLQNFNREGKSIQPLLDLNGINIQDGIVNDQGINQLINTSQIQSLFDNIESHRGDFLIQDIAQILTSRIGTFDGQQNTNLQIAQNMDNYISPSDESTLSSNIINSEKQCQSVANTFYVLADQFSSLHGSFKEYEYNIYFNQFKYEGFQLKINTSTKHNYFLYFFDQNTIYQFKILSDLPVFIIIFNSNFLILNNKSYHIPELKFIYNQFQILFKLYQNRQRIDESIDKSNQLIQKIIKFSDENEKEVILEKVKMLSEIKIFKNDISSAFEQSNIFIDEFDNQTKQFMKEIQQSNQSIEEIVNDIQLPKIPINVLVNIKSLFEKISNQNNLIFIMANKSIEELQREKNISKDFLIQKFNQNIENLIALFKEISNLYFTCTDTFESIEHTSERLTKFFIHMIRLLQAKQAINYSTHKRNQSKDNLNVHSNQILQNKPISATNQSKDIQNIQPQNLNSRLNRQQSSKDFNIQNNLTGQKTANIVQQQQQLDNQQLLEKQEIKETPKKKDNLFHNEQQIQSPYTPSKQKETEEEQKNSMESKINQTHSSNYKKEYQHLKNQKSDELRLEELIQNSKNIVKQNYINKISFLQSQLQEQQFSNIITPVITPHPNDNQNKNSFNIPISPNSPHLQINQLKSNAQSALLRSSKQQQELEVLKFKFSDFEKTSLQRYDSLLKTKEQVEKDYSQITQNYTELQSSYGNLLQKYSGLQDKYEEQLVQIQKNNNEIEREDLISQISSLRAQVNDLQKQINQSDNQKQLISKDKQILKDQLNITQKDYENLEKAYSLSTQQNQKLIENNRELIQQNTIISSNLIEAENTIQNLKTVTTPRLPSLQEEKDNNQQLLKNLFENVTMNISQNQQLISLLSDKNLNNNQINSNHLMNTDGKNQAQDESQQDWNEILKMQIQQKQFLLKQIQMISSALLTQQGDNILEQRLKAINQQQYATQQTQTELYSLVNTQQQFFDSMVSPPSKTSTIVMQPNQVINNNTFEDTNSKSTTNLLTSTTMTLPNILESVRKHQNHLQQTKNKSLTGNTSIAASEKIQKSVAQRYNEEDLQNISKVQQNDWQNTSPDLNSDNKKLGKNIQKNEITEEENISNSQPSSSTKKKSLQKSRNILKQMTNQTKQKNLLSVSSSEENTFLQTKKKTINDHKSLISDLNNESGGKKATNKSIDIHSHMEANTNRNFQRRPQTNTSDYQVNNISSEQSKRDQKSPNQQQDQKHNNTRQYLINNFLKNDNKKYIKQQNNESSTTNQLIKQQQNHSSNQINSSQLNSNNTKINHNNNAYSHNNINNNSNNQNINSSNINNSVNQIKINTNNSINDINNNNTGLTSHYKTNSNITDRVQTEHSKKQMNCLKSVINAYKNIQNLKKMQEVLKTDESLTHQLNKTAHHIPNISSYSNHQTQNSQLSQQNNNNNNNSNDNNSLNKVYKKITRSQSNLSSQNCHKGQNPININLFSQLMNINYSHCISARQKSNNFKSTRNVDNNQQDFNAINLYNSAKQQNSSGSKVSKKKKKSTSQGKISKTANNNNKSDISNINNSNFFQNNNNCITSNSNIEKDINTSQIQSQNLINVSNLNNTYTNVTNSNAHVTPNHVKSISSIHTSIYQPHQQNQSQMPNSQQQHQENAPYLVQDILTANKMGSNQAAFKSHSNASVITTSKNRSQNSASDTSSHIQQQNPPVYHHTNENPNKKKIMYKNHLEDQHLSEIIAAQLKKTQGNSQQDRYQNQKASYQ